MATSLITKSMYMMTSRRERIFPSPTTDVLSNHSLSYSHFTLIWSLISLQLFSISYSSIAFHIFSVVLGQMHCLGVGRSNALVCHIANGFT